MATLVLLVLLGSGVFISLTVATGARSTDSNDCLCGFAGRWVNDLGSTAEFSCQNGSLGGKYNSAVGHAEDFYNVAGRYTMVGPDQRDSVVGWSVAYNNQVRGNSNSTASFTGVYYASEDRIHVTWVLTRYTSRADMWSNSRIGRNIFTRQ